MDYYILKFNIFKSINFYFFRAKAAVKTVTGWVVFNNSNEAGAQPAEKAGCCGVEFRFLI
jgi:hypothetical protein